MRTPKINPPRSITLCQLRAALDDPKAYARLVKGVDLSDPQAVLGLARNVKPCQKEDHEDDGTPSCRMTRGDMKELVRRLCETVNDRHYASCVAAGKPRPRSHA